MSEFQQKRYSKRYFNTVDRREKKKIKIHVPEKKRKKLPKIIIIIIDKVYLHDIRQQPEPPHITHFFRDGPFWSL